jgi:predicted phosphodiesterase
MPKIALIGDSHLRDAHLGVTERGPDFFAGMMNALKKAAEEKVSVCFHGGDILNSARPSTTNVMQLLAFDMAAKDLKLPVYTVTGNHDRITPSWVQALSEARSAAGLSGKAEQYGLLCVDDQLITDPVLGLTIRGIPACGREELLAKLEAAKNSDTPKADILLWHGTVAEFVDFPITGAVTLEDLHAYAEDYRAVLLGDIHKWGFQQFRNGVPIGYPGSTELTEKSEDFQKYIAIWEVPAAGPFGMPRQVPFKTRDCLAFRISSEDDLSRIIAELQGKTFPKPPIIFLAFNPEIDGVVRRIKNALPPGALVRYAATEVSSLELVGGYAKERIDAGVSLGALAQELASGEAGFKTLVGALVSEDVNPKELIAEYVATRLRELETQ